MYKAKSHKNYKPYRQHLYDLVNVRGAPRLTPGPDVPHACEYGSIMATGIRACRKCGWIHPEDTGKLKDSSLAGEDFVWINC